MRMVKTTMLVLLAVAAMGCGKPKQAQPPRIPDEAPGSSDLAGPEPEAPIPVEGDKEAETDEQRKQKCYQQCVDGLADDKSGDPPGALSCTTLTSKMEAGCIVWFDKNPTTAKEAQNGLTPAEG
jgi:hypothetical protein